MKEFCSFHDIIKPFLGREVIVRIENLTVMGKLIHFSMNGERGCKPHKPSVLILKNGETPLLIRGNWTAIREL